MSLERLKRGLERTRGGALAGLQAFARRGRGLAPCDLDRLEEMLIGADVGAAAAGSLVDAVREKLERERADGEAGIRELERCMVALLDGRDRTDRVARGQIAVIMAVGANGAGKTTSIAKLAYHYKGQGLDVVLGAADTFRAASIEQLAVWSERLNVRMVKHGYGADPAAVAYDCVRAAAAGGGGVAIIDTAGRLHTKEGLLQQLQKIARVVAAEVPGAPHEVLLVLDAAVGQNAIQQARAFSDAVPVTGIFLAKLDGTARGGVVVPIEQLLDIPVKWVGTGEQVEDLSPFVPAQFVSALLSP